MTNEEAYLKAILATVARQTFPPDQLKGLVGRGSKQLAAYNLCDGQLSQKEIAKAAGLDTGNLSKAIARWVEAGVVIRVGEGRDERPLHVYPLPENAFGKSNSKESRPNK